MSCSGGYFGPEHSGLRERNGEEERMLKDLEEGLHTAWGLHEGGWGASGEHSSFLGKGDAAEDRQGQGWLMSWG